MALRKKILIIIGLTLTFMLALLYVTSNTIVLSGFTRLEEQNVRTNVERVQNAVADEIDNLNSACGDWAPWNDTRDFVLGKKPDYIENNLNDSTLDNLKVDFMIFVDSANKVVHAKAIDPVERTDTPISAALINHISTHQSLLQYAGTHDSKSGIVLLEEGPILIAGWPISNSEYEEPINGTLFFGRYFNDNEIRNLSRRTRLSVKAVSPDSPAIAADFREAKTRLSEQTPIAVQLFGDSSIAGYITLGDIHGKDGLILRVDLPRQIYMHGSITVTYFVMAILMIGAVLMIVLLIALQRTVLGPVESLTNHFAAVGKSDDLTAMLLMPRRDEIGVMAKEFDKMVVKLADARNKLVDQSYTSGMADLASGVLHNVRNTLMPVSIQIENLRKQILEIPLEQIEMARRELDEGSPSSQRREDLEEFLDVSSRSLTNIIQTVQDKLQDVSAPVVQVEKILAEQEKHTHAEQPLDVFELGPMILDAIALLPKGLESPAEIELDPSISGITVKANRLSLLQVIYNLIVNATESIRQAQQAVGKITITASAEQKGGIDFVHVRIRDNGAGIEPENLDRIFERGFSTKQSHTGKGLHWSANAIFAVGGRIYVESKGKQQGACFHMLFPKEPRQ